MIEVLHTIVGFSSLAFGALVLFNIKGTLKHKILGKLYVVSMLILNLTAFGIYGLFNYGWGIFHWAAIASLATVLAGVLVLIFRKKIKSWLLIHYELMIWSYLGLLGATSNELFVHILFFNNLAKTNPPLPIVTMVFIFIFGAIWLYASKKRILNETYASHNT